MWSDPYVGFTGDAVVKNLPANVGDARDMGLISGLGRSLGEGNGNPLQYFCLEDPMDRGTWQATVHRVAESDPTKQLNFHFSFRYGEQCEGSLKTKNRTTI